jgi:hypothetical protein
MYVRYVELCTLSQQAQTADPFDMFKKTALLLLTSTYVASLSVKPMKWTNKRARYLRFTHGKGSSFSVSV